MEERFFIEGGRRLEGVVSISGAKNAALPILAASLMVPGTFRLKNIPRLTDIETQLSILRHLGKRAVWVSRSTLELIDDDFLRVDAPEEMVRRMRAGFCVLGPLLARRGRAVVPLPGGCAIGPRPVDLHLKGLSALGAEIELAGNHVIASARRLRGATIQLAGPCGSTVTGTANLMMAAVLARGETVILGSAREPEIIALGIFLNACGGRIHGLGTSTLRILGVRELSEPERTDGSKKNRIDLGAQSPCRMIGDRIEAGTLLMAAMITGGEVTLEGIDPEMLRPVWTMLARTGGTIHCHRRSESSQGAITLKTPFGGVLRSQAVVARGYPGFPTDLQAQAMAMLSLGEQRSSVEDRVFPDRLGHVAELNRLGAKIRLSGHRAWIEPVSRFLGGEACATDLRAGAALVMAGLAAEGTTIVRRAERLRRGYENLDEKLVSLGAVIRRGFGKRKAG